MRVESLMTKDVGSSRPDEPAECAARIMWERDCGFVPVVSPDEERRVLGVVTDRDLCMAAYTRGCSLKEIRVGDVMTAAPCTATASDELAEAERRMQEARVRRLPVVDDAGQLLGVISLADLAQEAARHAAGRGRTARERELCKTVEAVTQPRAVAARRPARPRRKAR
jgi:CBS-domain-containing membrane protein